jgi:O-acetyl-ADP-ribose deacetylase (regulator of RNase III)
VSAPAAILGPVPKITAVAGDITEQRVDAIVNAANSAMRGGGGVDGAIHRAGGPAILRDCVHRFPDGLATGDAGWTTAGDLPARWVIHTVGPNYNAGQRDRSLLESCYRRALDVADEIGARTVAFPLISSGIFGWPSWDAIEAAVETIAGAETRVEEVRLVTLDSEIHRDVLAALAEWTPLRILQGVRFLHQHGYHRLRVLPGLSPSGMSWRIAITNADNLNHDWDDPRVIDRGSALRYTTGQRAAFAGGEVTVASTPEAVGELILNALPETTANEDDPDYVSWFAELVDLCELSKSLPVAYADLFDASGGWKLGSGARYPLPPDPPSVTPRRPE